MTPRQYQAARHELQWTNAQVAKALCKTERTIYRWLEIDDFDPMAARLIRLLVRLRMSMSETRFSEVLKEMEKD